MMYKLIELKKVKLNGEYIFYTDNKTKVLQGNHTLLTIFDALKCKTMTYEEIVNESLLALEKAYFGYVANNLNDDVLEIIDNLIRNGVFEEVRNSEK